MAETSKPQAVSDDARIPVCPSYMVYLPVCDRSVCTRDAAPIGRRVTDADRLITLRCPCGGLAIANLHISVKIRTSYLERILIPVHELWIGINLF